MTHSDNPTFPHFLTYDLSQSALHVEVFQDVNPSVFLWQLFPTPFGSIWAPVTRLLIPLNANLQG